MLEIQGNSVVYQAQTELLELAYEVANTRNYKKPEAQAKIRKGFNIYKSLQALSYDVYLTRAQKEKIWYCLIKQANINEFPDAPTVIPQGAPAIYVGIQGKTGDRGARGEDGGATDFKILNTGTDSVIDTFLPTDAYSARWDYLIYDIAGTNRRSGTVICDWSSDGSSVSDALEYSNTGTGNTEPVQFSVDFFGGKIRFIATILSGHWNIVGSRYFIPNNGAGTGVINTSLPNGQIFVGNSGNVAAPVTPSGDLSMSNAGAFTLGPGVVTNATISSTAAIALSKLAALTASKLVVTDSSGVLSTTSSPTLTELTYLSGVTSNIQTQLNGKVGAITGAISTVVSTDLTASKILVSNISGKIAIGGASSTEAGYLSGVTSPIQTQLNTKLTDPSTTAGDLIIRNGSNVVSRLGIGSNGTFLGSNGTVPSWQSLPNMLTVTGGTKRATQGYVNNNSFGSPTTSITYSTISFITPSESVWKISIRFTAQITGDGGGQDQVQFQVQKSLNGSSWSSLSEIPSDTYTTDLGSYTTVIVEGIDTTVSPSTTYYYRLIGTNVGGGNNYFSQNFGYLLHLVPA